MEFRVERGVFEFWKLRVEAKLRFLYVCRA